MKIPKTKYTMFANDAMEAFCKLKPTGAHAVVFMYILRHTVGCQRERQRISITRMSKELPYSKKWLLGVVSDLEDMGILKITQKKNGAVAVFEIREPKYWDEPTSSLAPWAVNSTSPVNTTSPTGELQFPRPVNSTSPEPVNTCTPEPVNSTSPIIERRKKKLFKKNIVNTPDGVNDDMERTEDAVTEEDIPDDDGWEDPLVTWKKLKETYGDVGDV